MSFTTCLTIGFVDPFPVASEIQSIDATTWRLFATIDVDDAMDHQVPVEQMVVSVVPINNTLTSSFITFNEDLSFFEITHTDFVSLTFMKQSDPGFLFRSGKLTAMPSVDGIAGVKVFRVRGSIPENDPSIQIQVANYIPYSIPDLPPGFSGEISAVNIDFRPDAIHLTLPGSVTPPEPPELPELPELPDPPDPPKLPNPSPPPPPPAPEPVTFTITSSLQVEPSLNLHEVKQLVKVTDRGTVINFAGADLPSNIVAIILDVVGIFITESLSEAIRTAVENAIIRLIENLVQSNLPPGATLPEGTTSVQRIIITDTDISFDGARGSFIMVPYMARTGFARPISTRHLRFPLR
jgi:hypothetical protein